MSHFFLLQTEWSAGHEAAAKAEAKAEASPLPHPSPFCSRICRSALAYLDALVASLQHGAFREEL